MTSQAIDPRRLRTVEQRLLADDTLLPTLPEIAFKVKRLVEDECAGIHEVARLIQSDPALSGRIIQVANAAQFSHLAKVTTVQAAINRLGLKAVRNTTLSFSLRSAVLVEQGPYRHRLHRAWEQSISLGAVSHVLATVTVGLEADQAMLGGLLHHLGELALIRVADALALSPEALESLLPLHEVEVAERVLNHWRLEEFLPLVRWREDWQAVEAGEGAGYLDLLVVARYHVLLGRPQAAELPPLPELPAFGKFPMLRLGPDMSIELLRESQRQVDEIKRLLQ